MIIKKPYAFLIKNFRVIHGFLFAALLFITLKSYNVYSFFNDYAVNGYFTNKADLTSTYVSYFIFIIIVISSLISLLIFYLLNIKKKENKIYLFLFLYMIILFVYYIYIYSTFSKLEISYLSIESVRVIRDISLIALLPQLIFTLVMLARTLGFNIKQFDFKKDLENLDIVQSDNEEVEISVGDNSYKLVRLFRKFLRLTKYFLTENKVFVIGLSSLIALILSLTIFLRIKVYNTQYVENQKISANSLVFNVNSSYITQYDIENNIITKDKYYLLIDININNKYISDYSLSRESFTLLINNNQKVPIFSLKNEFIDFGISFQPTNISSKSDNNYIVIFEIDSKDLNSKYTLYIKNYDNRNFGEIESKFKQIVINPKNIDKLKEKGTYNLVAVVDLKDTLLKEGKITISDYEISDKFKEKYSIPLNNTYKDIYYTIVPNNIGSSKKTVLKLKTKFEISDDNRIYNYISSASELLNNYGIIKYESLGKVKTINVDTITSKYNNDKFTYIEVPSDIKNAKNIQLLLVIRGIKYTIILK